MRAQKPESTTPSVREHGLCCPAPDIGTLVLRFDLRRRHRGIAIRKRHAGGPHGRQRPNHALVAV